MYGFYFKILINLAIISHVTAITCFHCDSRTSLACRNDENFDDSENLREQDEFGNECAYCTEATFQILGGTVVQRRCENANYDLTRQNLRHTNDCAVAWFYDIEGEICVCDDDNCNSRASQVVLSLMTLAITFVTLKILV